MTTAGGPLPAEHVPAFHLDGIKVRKERLRPVDPAAVAVLAASMAREGLMQPIGVQRGFPGGWVTLVYGLHRLEAAKQLGWETIPAMVFGKGAPATELEALENLCRSELSPYDRAWAVQGLREAMLDAAGIPEGTSARALGGRIAHGGPDGGASVNFTVVALAERLGRSKAAIEKDLDLARRLHRDLAAVMRGREGWDTATVVIACSKLEGCDQTGPVAGQQGALRDWLVANPEGSLKDGLAAVVGAPELSEADAQDRLFLGAVNSFMRVSRLRQPKLLREMLVAARPADRPELVLEAAQELDGAQLEAVIASLELAFSMTPEGVARASQEPPRPVHPLDPATGQPIARRSGDR